MVIAGQYVGIEIVVVLVKFAVFLAFLAMLYSFFGNYLIARYVLSLYHKENGEKMIKVVTVLSGQPGYVNNLKTPGGKITLEFYRIPIFMGVNGACSKAAQTYRRYRQFHGETLVSLSDLRETDEGIKRRLQHALIDHDLDELAIDAFIFELRAERINRRNWLWRIFN